MIKFIFHRPKKHIMDRIVDRFQKKRKKRIDHTNASKGIKGLWDKRGIGDTTKLEVVF